MFLGACTCAGKQTAPAARPGQESSACYLLEVGRCVCLKQTNLPVESLCWDGNSTDTVPLSGPHGTTVTATTPGLLATSLPTQAGRQAGKQVGRCVCLKQTNLPVERLSLKGSQ